jgi:hypothetical protein
VCERRTHRRAGADRLRDFGWSNRTQLGVIERRRFRATSIPLASSVHPASCPTKLDSSPPPQALMSPLRYSHRQRGIRKKRKQAGQSESDKLTIDRSKLPAGRRSAPWGHFKARSYFPTSEIPAVTALLGPKLRKRSPLSARRCHEKAADVY